MAETGHAEAVEVVYDPAIVTYDKLLDHYWHNVDPFTAHRQFCDIGTQYRPEIFVLDADQRAAAEASKARMQQRFKNMAVVVAITDAGVLSGRGVSPGLLQEELGAVSLLPLWLRPRRPPEVDLGR